MFYDGYAPTAVGVALLRKRKATLPIEWEQTHGAAIAAVPPPPMDGAFSDAVPHALPEAAGAIKRALAAAPGLIVSPHLLKQQPTEKAAKKKGGPGKQPRAEAADTEAEVGTTPTPKGKMHRAEAGNVAATPAKSEDAAGSPATRKSKKGGKNGGASPTVAADTAAATATPKAAASTPAKASPAAAAAAATPSSDSKSVGKKKSKPTPKSGKKK
uniref:Uncharacterized protein n=1 Tax=Neobodo designis TaxID=312471 RepID=A0A7S1QHS3_NEODS